MRKLLITTACAMAVLGLTATKAHALAVGDSRYIGHVNDGIPSNVANEVLYVNSLLDLAPGAAAVTCSLAPNETCDRIGSPAGLVGLQDATAGVTTDTPGGSAGTINTTGWTYLLGKYDAGQAGAYVWYVAGLTSATIPNSIGTCGNSGCGLSHYTLFNGGAVPDGGATIGLLGLAMLGLGYVRRRLA
jgi:VPDSG-CTERM motif